MREKKKTGRGKRTTLGREERKSPRARKEPSLAMYTTFFPISPVYSDGPPLQGKLGGGERASMRVTVRRGNILLLYEGS